MIAFEVHVNRERVCTAGVGDLGVLTAVASWVRRAPENSRDGQSFEEELTFEVRGLDPKAHVSWYGRDLQVGDLVQIKVVAAETVDTPSTRQPREDAAAVERGERQYFEYLKQKFETKPRTSAKKKKKTTSSAKRRK